ncbi:MAG TPA: ABC transporter substrate-binding protein [Pseudonocardiaceae bacterium]|jgi:sulfonate transport system substrate-binding protein|nr:ABC transporter substrate-binding protein [Pseudonocardiaceae bacterium]
MKLRELIVAATALAAVTGLAACGGGSGASAPAAAPVPATVSPAALSSVTLRVGDQKGAGLQVLLQAAGLADTPYKLSWSTFTSGPPLLEAANDNAVDVGEVGNTPPIFSAAANGNIDVVAALRSSVGDSVLVGKNSPIHSLADLRGKTIAVAKGSSANGTLLNTLAKAGLKPSDVTISYLQPADAYAAFSQGSVAAWAVWDPYVTEAVANLGAKQLVSGADALHGTGLAAGSPLSNGYSFLTASRTALADAGRNTALADFVTRVDKAEQWAATHLDAWAAIYAQQTGIPLATVQKAIGQIVLSPVTLDDSVVAAEQKLSDAFTSAGQLPGKVAFSSFVDRRFTAEIAPLVKTK